MQVSTPTARRLSEGSIAMTPVASSASWAGRLSVVTAYVALAFVGAIVLGFF